MKSVFAPALCAALLVSACATSYTVTPVAGAGQSIRYIQGQATTFAEGEHGSIQVTPLGVNDKGRLVFGVAAFNTGDEPTNFGVENMTAEAAGAPLRIFTSEELQRMAQNDATIALVVTALAGAASAYAATQGPTYSSTYSTPRGTYRYTATNHTTQAVLAGAAVGATAVSMKEINDSLDSTLMQLQGQVLQTTTIDPDSSFGGQVITDRVAIPADAPLEALLNVTWNEDTYRFRWNVSQAR